MFHESAITITTTSRATTKNATTSAVTVNINYITWIHNDDHVQSINFSTISKASFYHVQGNTARELWLNFWHAYALNTTSREYTLKILFLKLQMKGDETPLNYLSRGQDYTTALANIDEHVKDKNLVH